ncbi:MAG: hypothetical protein ABSD88_14860 [Candidatus Korobacteraceae bacterium]|jgi:asparagine N-glycosylation enzyme membrane subunit Stt3
MKLPSQKKKEDWPPPQWRMLIFYGIVTLFMLWVWQEAAPQAVVRTIAIAILLGVYKPEEGIRKIVALVMLMVLIPAFIALAQSIWFHMPLWQRGLVILIGILIAAAAVRGKSHS